MKLREYENRFQDGNITGAVIYLPEQGRELVLRFYSGGLAWFMQPDDYIASSGTFIMVNIPIETLLNYEVIRWIHKTPLMEGDSIYVEKNGVLVKEMIERIKEGDGSPYPIVTKTSQYQWAEICGIVSEGKK